MPWALIAGIIFIAVNLRAPLTSVGPLVGLIRNDLHISNTLAGAITAVPLFAFALFSPLAPKLAQRFKVEPVLLASIILLTSGILIRSLSGTIALFTGTALLGLAISVCNVLLPSLIKREFPERIGIMTGIYAVSMNLCGAVASGISVPLAVGAGFGWQGALGIWGALSLISVLCWLPQTRKRPQSQTAVRQQPSRGETRVWRSPLAWQVTLFMGLQSLVFYVIITWLPEILGAQGIGPGQSGWLLSIMQLAVLPFTLAVPIIAGRMSNQRPLVYFSAVMFVIGFMGLLYGSIKLAVLWISVLGIGIGCVFSLAMMFFSLRTRTAQQAAELSGMAQSVGYLLAAIGPSFFGYLHDRSGSWMPPLWILFGVSVLMILFGISSAKQRYVDSP
nr:MFS transporter [Paenibacillus thalictri]